LRWQLPLAGTAVDPSAIACKGLIRVSVSAVCRRQHHGVSSSVVVLSALSGGVVANVDRQRAGGCAAVAVAML
jgi:hypothetical protein